MAHVTPQHHRPGLLRRSVARLISIGAWGTARKAMRTLEPTEHNEFETAVNNEADKLLSHPLLLRDFLRVAVPTLLAERHSPQNRLSGVNVIDKLIGDLCEHAGKREFRDAISIETDDVAGALRAEDLYDGFTIAYHPARFETRTEYHGVSGMEESTYEVKVSPAWKTIEPDGARHESPSVQLTDQDSIIAEMKRTNWMWHKIATDSETQRQVIDRICTFQNNVPGIIDRLYIANLIPAIPHSVYLLGSLPWTDHPSDIDLFLILPGRYAYQPIFQVQLNAKHLQLPRPQNCSASFCIETIGNETFHDVIHGAKARHAQHIKQRSVLLFASVLLAGKQFSKTSETPTEQQLHSLQEDLLKDAKRARWPELQHDSRRIAAKKKWRKTEIEAIDSYIQETA